MSPFKLKGEIEMKTQIGKTYLFAITSALILWGSAAVAAPIISVDLGAGEAVESGDVAGFIPTNNWNHAFGYPDVSGEALNYSDGTASGASLSADFASNKTSPVGVGADPNTEMFNRGGTINSGAGSDITVSGISTNGDWAYGYDVYVYFASRSDASTTDDLNLTIGDTTFLIELTGGVANYSGTFEQADATDYPRASGKNFVKFSGVSGSSFTLNAFCPVNDRLLVTGLQIVPVPKPERSILSVDLGNTGETLESGDTAGVYPVANWAVAAGSPDLTNAPLSYSDGAASDATISADFTYNKTTTIGVTADANTEMYNRGGGILNGAGTDITVDGLPTTSEWTGGYDVYVYFAPSAGYSTTNDLDLTIGETTYYTTLATSSTNYTGSFAQATATDSGSRDSGKNYAKFTGVTGTSFTLNAVCNQMDRIAITGMQIVSGLIGDEEPNDPATPAYLSISGGSETLTITATNLTATASNTLKAADALSSTNWLAVGAPVTGVTETNWVVSATNSATFYKVDSE
jgi:hypothetical protein